MGKGPSGRAARSEGRRPLVNTGAPLPGLDEAELRVLHFQRKLHEWAQITHRCVRGEPDAGELARPVRRAAAEKPAAERPTRRSAVDPYIAAITAI